MQSVVDSGLDAARGGALAGRTKVSEDVARQELLEEG